MEYDEEYYLARVGSGARYQEDIPPQRFPSKGRGRPRMPREDIQEEEAIRRFAEIQIARDMESHANRQDITYSGQQPSRAGRHEGAEPDQEYERQQPSQAGRHEGAEQYQDPREDQFLKPINIMTRAQRQKIQSQQQPSRGAGLHDVPAQFYQEEVPEYGPATHSVPRGQLQEQTRQPPSRGAGQRMVAEPYQEYERQHPSQAGRHEGAEQYQDPREDQFLKPINIMTRAQRQKIQSQQQPSRGAGLHDVPAQFYQEEVPEYGPATLSVPRGQLQEQTRQRNQRQQEGPRMPPPTESHGDAATPREPTNVELLSHAMQQLDMKNKNRSVVEKKGETGTQIKLTANYIPMHVTPGSGIFEYEVTFDPHVDHLACRFTLLKEMEEIIGSTRTFDGAMLYLPRKLESEIYRWCTTHPLNTTDVDVYVRYRRQRHMGECTQFYNVLLFRIMNELKLVRLGRQHYDPFAAKVLPQQKLEVWPGYVTSVEDYEGGLMLVCDASHRVLRQQTALDVIADITRTQFTECELEVKHLLVGASVLTRYNNKLYRIDDVCFSMSPRDTFVKNGREITFVDYYKQQYGLDILVMDQPVILTRQTFRSRNLAPGEREPTQFLVLIPELCYMTGLTDNMRNDHKGMKEIATVTLLNPNQRHYSIKQFLNGIEKCPRAQEILSAWGLSIARETVKLHGRILTGEELHFGNGAKIKVSNEGEWKNAVQRLNMLQVVDLLDWGLIYCQRDHSSTDNFVSTLLRVGPALGMVVREPTHVLKLDNDRLNTYMKALQCLVERKMQLVVLIFPTLRNDRYSAVKYFCNVQAGLLSQVIQAHTLNRCTGFSSIVQSIALQMNCKLGGALWTTPNPFKSVMVVGIDVYHDMKNKSRSVVGVVSSLNQNLTHYYSQVIYQDPKQELIDSLRYSFISSIEHYYNVNHCFPARIFIYRDGVGDGQLQTLVGHEVEQLINCFPDLTLDDEPYDPKFTVVVVQKRINTKLLAEKPQHQWENPPPGTVVDHTITKKFLYDFFLVAQSVRQGTVHPTHYIVAYDNSQLKPDYLQRFTYKLCHMYYNWMGIVRVPAPCQYAHRLAAHAGQHLKTAFHPALAEHLFYL